MGTLPKSIAAGVGVSVAVLTTLPVIGTEPAVPKASVADFAPSELGLRRIVTVQLAPTGSVAAQLFAAIMKSAASVPVIMSGMGAGIAPVLLTDTACELGMPLC